MADDLTAQELEAIVGGLSATLPGQVSRAHLGRFARGLRSPQTRREAYDTALSVCRADGELNGDERAFLDELARELGLEREFTRASEETADALIDAPLDGDAGARGLREDEIISSTALLCGALELLPQGMASLAILPLQMRMVYRIGKLSGHELDRGHIRELLATVGVGLASQYLEGFARRIIGGLVGSLAGGFLRGLAGAATGSAFSYATTLALGQVAKRYYAGGRKLSSSELRQSFGELFDDARGQASRQADQIRERAGRLDVGGLLDLVRAT
jgi:uncharacterized protein (DUF697 family)